MPIDLNRRRAMDAGPTGADASGSAPVGDLDGGAGDGGGAEDAARTTSTLWSDTADASPPTIPLGIAVDDTDVCWTNEQTRTGVAPVMKCPKTGCDGPPTEVVPAQPAIYGPNAIAVDATSVYFTFQANGSRVMTCPKTGCTGTPAVLATNQEYPAAIAVDATNVYWVNNATASGNGEVMKCAVAGCGGAPTPLASGQDGPTGIAVDATNVYWTNSGAHGGGGTGTVMKCAIDGCGGKPTVVASSQAPLALALAGTRLYWPNNGQAYTVDGGIVTADVGGGGANVIARALGFYPTVIAADDVRVYWADPNPNSAAHGLLSCPISGCTGAPTLLSSAPTAYRIAIDGTSIYWTDAAAYAVMKLTPK